MRGYQGIDLPLSGCVHFVRNDEVHGATVVAMLREAKERGLTCAYVDYEHIAGSGEDPVAAIAALLGLENEPYPSPPWVPFLDDLITLSYRAAGMVIIIDNANIMLKEKQNYLFDLVEAFLIQFHHWFEKKKPCHLCFQMERNDQLTKLLSVGAVGPRAAT